MRFCFVSTSRGSYFMTELLAALAAATASAGHDVELVLDEFPPLAEDLVYVVVPHEFESWGRPRGRFPDAEQRARTIALCTENPGTEWFEATYRLVDDFGAAVSINRSSAAELRRRGTRCEHVQLGYYVGWDRWHGDAGSSRAIDVLYLGAADRRRDPLLADIGMSLWSRECQLLVPPLEPRTRPRADFLTEQRKYERLAQSKILLNLHRTTSAAFEWMRFLEAICNGCVVLSEPSLDADPLIPGEHFVQAPVGRIADTANALLDEPERLRSVREQAYRFVREQLPIEPAGRRLAELAAGLPRRVSVAAGSVGPARAAPASGSAAAPTPANAVSAMLASADSHTAAPSRPTRGERLRDGLLGRLARVRDGRQAHRHDVIAETPSYADARPQVSVLSVVEEELEDSCVEQLKGVIASRSGQLEILVLMISSRRRGGRALRRLLAEQPTVPMLMLHAGAHAHATGPGLYRAEGESTETGCKGPETAARLGAARNLLVDRARGENLLVLPLVGGVFPTTIDRLTRALEADARAFFAYPMVAVIENGATVELRGSLPWEPQRLTRGNWIDAPALIRRERLIELGGYGGEAILSGLEDFDLWCRVADVPAAAVHVPQVLAWHAPRDSAPPRGLNELPADVAELLRERSPGLFDERDRA